MVLLFLIAGAISQADDGQETRIVNVSGRLFEIPVGSLFTIPPEIHPPFPQRRSVLLYLPWPELEWVDREEMLRSLANVRDVRLISVVVGRNANQDGALDRVFDGSIVNPFTGQPRALFSGEIYGLEEYSLLSTPGGPPVRQYYRFASGEDTLSFLACIPSDPPTDSGIVNPSCTHLRNFGDLSLTMGYHRDNLSEWYLIEIKVEELLTEYHQNALLPDQSSGNED